jgi:hypothetical protein
MILQREHLIVVSALLTASCVLPYLRDIRRGSTRPQRASWFVFSTLSIIAAVSQFAGDGGPGAWLAAGSATGFFTVFVVSIRTGVGGFSRADRLTLLVAAVAVAASVLTSTPLLALIGVIVAEIAAVLLTVRKTFDDPTSETASTWLLDGAAGVAALAAVYDFTNLNELLYPIHHVLANLAVVVAIVAGHRAAATRTVPRPSVDVQWSVGEPPVGHPTLG